MHFRKIALHQPSNFLDTSNSDWQDMSDYFKKFRELYKISVSQQFLVDKQPQKHRISIFEIILETWKRRHLLSYMPRDLEITRRKNISRNRFFINRNYLGDYFVFCIKTDLYSRFHSYRILVLVNEDSFKVIIFVFRFIVYKRDVDKKPILSI